MRQSHTTCLPTDRRILRKIEELVRDGVRRLVDMRLHIKNFVEHELFAGRNVPPMSDSRFWPSAPSIVHCMYRANRRSRCVLFNGIEIV